LSFTAADPIALVEIEIMRRILTYSLGLVLCVGAYAAAQQPAPRVIRGMRYPAVSADGSRVAFSYRGDLWTVPIAGGEAKRVAERTGWDTRARWSPDGTTLAFCSDLNGNTDIFTIPLTGGTAKQITHHTSEDILSDWSADGKSLIFYSARETRVPAIYSIGLEDGRLKELTQDDIALLAPAVSANGQLLAYGRGRGDWARKGYRGAANSDLWLLPLNSSGATPRRLTTFAGNDLWPMFSPDGKSVYYTSDADGVANLWKVSVNGGKPAQVTRQKDGYIHYPTISRDGKTVAYETDFSLWAVDPTSRSAQPRRLTVTAAVEDKPRMETRNLGPRAEELEVSPDGNLLAVGMRGDIFIVPSTGGDARRVTASLARDYDFEWSPDSRSLAYVSERDANQDIYLLDVASGVSRRITTNTELDGSPQFSPDGRMLSFVRGNSGAQVCTVPVSGGAEKVAITGAFMSVARWSPDSRWLAFSRRTAAAVTNVFVAPAAGGSEINVSRWNGQNTNPLWSPDGSRLFFFSSRSGGSDIYAADLARKAPVVAVQGSGNTAGPSVMPTDVPSVTIDAEGISKRVRPLAGAPAGNKVSLAFTPDRKSCLFTVITSAPTQGGPGRRGGGGPGGPPPGGAVLYSLPLSGGGQPTKVAEGLGGQIRFARDGSALYSYGFGSLRRVALPSGMSSDVTVKASFEVDLAEERRQTFDQAWRLMRDSFYDPQLHGTDWNGIRARYRPIVDECLDIKDFHLLLTEMVGELNASHTGASTAPAGGRRGGGGEPDGERNDTASLGVWLDWSGNGPGLKVTQVLRDGPADKDESRIKVGEYLLAIGGQDVAPTEAFVKSLAGQGGKTLDVLVNSTPSKTGARTVKLNAISRGQFSGLLYEHWVQNNADEVARLSQGKLAYLHIKAMDQPSLQRFERELVTEAFDKEGLVLDVRNNGGGRIHDELFAILNARVHAYETPRGGLKMTQPFGAFTRKMTLLINGSSFSDAEIFPNGFRANGLGKIVGVPTGGGVIGTGDITLLDNITRFRVPRTGWHTLDGRNLENWGVPPDYYVEITPADYLAGHDPQLERAAKELLKELKVKRAGK